LAKCNYENRWLLSGGSIVKTLTFDEYQERLQAIQRARRIFSSLTGNNITKSFAAYQEILAEQERDAFVSTKQAGSRSQTFLDEYERPECPRCGKELLLRGNLNRLNKKQNTKGWETCWFCPDSFLEEGCFHEEYSYKSISDWLNILKKKKKP